VLCTACLHFFQGLEIWSVKCGIFISLQRRSIERLPAGVLSLGPAVLKPPSCLSYAPFKPHPIGPIPASP
jgi:hypothetical protein